MSPTSHFASEEAALKLGKDVTLLARVLEWCEAKDHAGVRGEASRLLAAFVRHSRSPVSSTEVKTCLPFVDIISVFRMLSVTG